MNRTIAIILLVIFIFGGGFAVGRFTKSPETVTVTQEKIVWKKVEKNVSKMAVNEKNAALTCFYTSKPSLSVFQMPEDPFMLKVNAGLCEREWSTTAKIKVHESSNWQYYVGASIVGIGVGAAAYHFLSD